MKNKTILHSLGHAVLVMLYVAFVAWVMRHGEAVFGNDNDKNFWGPVAFLMLFVLSAAITSTLVLGRPVLLYLSGAKKEALRFFAYTLGWLFVLLALLFVINL